VRESIKTASDGGEAISPGTEWAPVWEAMANQIEEGKNGPRLLDCWHETLAVDIAAGYTLATGRMQGVLLHAGSGLLQGAMGIHAAWVSGVPMVVISGETTTYGEQPGFDPGAQWINNLSIPGSTTRLVEPVCKFASHAGGRYTVYESVIRSGEMAGGMDAAGQWRPHGTGRAAYSDRARGYREARCTDRTGQESCNPHRKCRSRGGSI
jgi:hypothetical protein